MRKRGLYTDHSLVYIVLICMSLILYVVPLKGQQATVDSLETIVRQYTTSGKTDTVLVKSLNELATVVIRSNIEQSFLYAKHAQEVASEIQYKEGIALSSINMGIALWKQGKHALALEADIKALTAYQELGNKRGIAKALNSIGIVHDTQHQPELALRYYNDALKIAQEIGDKQAQAYSLTNMGALSADQGKYEQALQYHLQGLKIKKELGNQKRIWSSMAGIGAVYALQKKYTLALEYESEALQICQKIGDKEGEAMTLLNIADINNKIGNAHRAIEIAQQSFVIVDKENLRLLKQEALLTLSQSYDSLRNEKMAFAYYKQYIVVRDSIFSEENNQKIAKIQVEYETTEKERQIQLLEQNQKLQVVWRNALIIGVILLIAVLILLFNRYRIKQRSEKVLVEKNSALSEANAEILQQQQTLTEQSQSIQLTNTQLQETIFQSQSTNHELEEANEIKMKFLHIASHDIKDLLSTLTEVSESFHHPESDHPANQQRLDALVQSTQNMHAVVIDVLQTNAKLEAENEVKVKLLSIAAHDLKNPLTTILGVARLLQGERLTTPDAPKMIEMIVKSAQNMYSLIAELLDQAAIQLGKVELHQRPVNIADLCADVIATYQHHTIRKRQQIEVSFDGMCIVYGDWKRLTQVVDNLISNAVKYSLYDTIIHVRLQATNTIVRLEVQDEGPGLTDDDKQKLFGFFQRLSAKPTGGESSNGVGLSSIKHIVELHGGYVWAESEYGEGSTFIVTLPRLLQPSDMEALES